MYVMLLAENVQYGKEDEWSAWQKIETNRRKIKYYY